MGHTSGLNRDRQSMVRFSRRSRVLRSRQMHDLLTRLPRAILHDDERYPEPDIFKPERFLKNGQIDQDVLDPGSVVFGFGRRYVPQLVDTHG